ncbi:hypothetical protein POM88_017343 [Heracleum sosnowskyi]|uniref:Replication factor A C-terminal domain-containing protein n=1 Tax=Heracleum sosnowskyi TaxID=360622 RepID=A0AAD8IP13_9APIA|nr:hypothetical protein POM88_017343 [Heracleum sosnowskyi]
MTIILMSKHSYMLINGILWLSILMKGAYTLSQTSILRKQQVPVGPVSSKILINFSPSTTVQKLTEDDFMIPLHKFEFVDLGDLFSIATKCPNDEYPEYSTDIIGVVEDFEHVSSIKTKFGQMNIVRFRITDGRNSHKVSIWGDLAVKAENDYNKAVETPVIAIVMSTRLKTYKSSVQISSLPSSKIYLNMDSDSVVAMRYRLKEEGYTVSQQSTGTPQEPVVQKKHFFRIVKDQNVEEADWWYNSCSDCEGEVEKVEGKLTCTNCTNKTIAVPEKRYRIVILAEDSSEAYNFILMDRATRHLTGMTATKMQSEMLKAS